MEDLEEKLILEIGGNPRLGIVKMSDSFMKQEALKIAYRYFTPIRITQDGDTHILLGWCDKFKLLKRGDKVPHYILLFRRFKNGNVRLTGVDEVKE